MEVCTMESRKLPDTPWHVGYTTKEEDDPRRHKSRCIYKQRNICHQGKSSAYMLRCPGSSHCKFYAESEAMAEDVYARTRSVEEEHADNMRGTLFAGKARISYDAADKKKTASETSKQQAAVFSGTEYIRMDQIKMPKEYWTWRPDPKAVERLMAYYDKYRKMDMPILVSVENGQYYIRDNFLQYYVSERLKKTWIKATMQKASFGGKK